MNLEQKAARAERDGRQVRWYKNHNGFLIDPCPFANGVAHALAVGADGSKCFGRPPCPDELIERYFAEGGEAVGPYQANTSLSGQAQPLTPPPNGSGPATVSDASPAPNKRPVGVRTTPAQAPVDSPQSSGKVAQQGGNGVSRHSNGDLQAWIAANPERAFAGILGVELTHKAGSRELYARCPFHDDSRPSLRINLDKQVWYCDPCGKGGSAFELAIAVWGVEFKDACKRIEQIAGLNGNCRRIERARALTTSLDKPPSGAQRKEVRRLKYEIRDLDGELKATHIRIEYSDGTKNMPWEPAGVHPQELPLYGIGRTADASDGDAVIVSEGEKAADSLWERQHLAVGTVTGAGHIPCDDSLRQLLRFKIYLWPDNDDQGREHMEKIGKRLAEMGAGEIRVIDWKEAPPKGDGADFEGEIEGLLETGTLAGDPILATIDKALIEVVSAGALRFDFASAYLEAFRTERGKSIELCAGMLRTRNLSLLVGRAWAGKTTISMNLVRGLRQSGMFLGRACRPDTKIAYLALERNGSEVAEQFEAWGIADQIFFLDRVPMGDPREMARALAYEIHRRGVEITIVDHLVGMIHLEDGNDYVGVSRALAPFNAIAKYTSSHVLLLHHQPKTAGMGTEINVMGSEAFRAATDCLMEASKIGQNYFFRAQSRGVPDVERLRVTRGEDGVLDSEPGVEGLKAEILSTLASAEGACTSAKIVDISPELKAVDRKNLTRALRELFEANLICRDGKGKRGSPFYYSVGVGTTTISSGPAQMSFDKT